MVHLVWHDMDDVWYKRSTDSGRTWAADTELVGTADTAMCPSIAASEDGIHLVWHDNRFGAAEILHRRSTDNGLSWEPPSRVSQNPLASRFPSVAVTGSIVHVVWNQQVLAGVNSGAAYYARSTDGGAFWEPEANLAPSVDDISPDQGPHVAVGGDVVHVTFTWGGGPPSLYYVRNATGGGAVGESRPVGLEQRRGKPSVVSGRSALWRIGKLEVRDASGRVIRRSEALNTAASGFAPGVYFVRAKGLGTVQKVVIAR
jgi:hypothetical protein